MMEKQVFSIREFCEAHSVSRALFYRLIAEGRGPQVRRIGRKVLITAEAAAAWRASLQMTERHGATAGPNDRSRLRELLGTLISEYTSEEYDDERSRVVDCARVVMEYLGVGDG